MLSQKPFVPRPMLSASGIDFSDGCEAEALQPHAAQLIEGLGTNFSDDELRLGIHE
jgi:hypothetical protein